MMNGISALLSAAVMAGAALTAHERIDSRSIINAAPPVVEVHAKDFSFSGPKTVKSGPVTFRLVNDGKELHHLTVIKLAKGKTMADFDAAMKKQGPPPGWISEVGGPNAAVPGGSIEATLALEPGTYALVCFIPSPGSPTPHMAKGMVSSITVLPEANGATMPVADVTVTLRDYAFGISKPFTAGKHVVKVVNAASQPHEIVFVKLAPGKTMKDFQNWAERDAMKGAPPGAPVPGMAAIAKGHTASFPVDLAAGSYGMICFAPDAKDGKSHSEHGMITHFEVK
jgi:hypothetical protein